jgi:hypothetical protein
MDKIQQNLDNIEKYLTVASLENKKLNNGVSSASPKLRSYLQNITKECSDARRLSLEKSKSLQDSKKSSKDVLTSQPNVAPNMSSNVSSNVSPSVSLNMPPSVSLDSLRKDKQRPRGRVKKPPQPPIRV